MRYIKLLIALFLIYACSSNTKKVYSDIPIWHSIYMELDGDQELTLYNYGDSAVFAKWTDSLVESNEGRKWIPTHERHERFIMKINEKDSLYLWARNLVNNPKQPEKYCSCYVGHLIVKINYGAESERITQTCEYSSVCDWDVVNKDTKSILKLLKTKLKEIE